MLLYRPVGLLELRLLHQTGMRAFPPRLPAQPIFYPVTNEPYATAIARDWNTKSETHAGFVTRFAVDDAYLARFERRVVGGREHEEVWVPAEELPAFNANVAGPIEVIGAHFGEGFVGWTPTSGAWAGKDARAQWEELREGVATEPSRAERDVTENPEPVFLNFAWWMALPDVPARDAVESVVRRVWTACGRGALPLGVVTEAR